MDVGRCACTLPNAKDAADSGRLGVQDRRPKLLHTERRPESRPPPVALPVPRLATVAACGALLPRSSTQIAGGALRQDFSYRVRSELVKRCGAWMSTHIRGSWPSDPDMNIGRWCGGARELSGRRKTVAEERFALPSSTLSPPNKVVQFQSVGSSSKRKLSFCRV